jgi:3-hydroxyacyl-[acyl-carrier protein] dehydratase/trans-2-decenoyl-[acyl-carrier protein] isomerase
VGEVKLSGMIRPDRRLVRYRVDFTKVIDRRLKMGVADGRVEADGEVVAEARDMRVGLAVAAGG